MLRFQHSSLGAASVRHEHQTASQLNRLLLLFHLHQHQLDWTPLLIALGLVSVTACVSSTSSSSSLVVGAQMAPKRGGKRKSDAVEEKDEKEGGAASKRQS